MLNDGEGGCCPLIGLVEIHQLYNCLKVQVPRPWLDKQSLALMSILFKVPGRTNSISSFYILR